MNDKEIPLFTAKKTPKKDVKLDPNGFFVIEVLKNQIRVEYYSNVYKQNKIVSGKLEKVFSGKTAAELGDTIAQHVPIMRPEHYIYLGKELQRAFCALQHNRKYEQDGC
jgi:dihydropteroate synthase